MSTEKICRELIDTLIQLDSPSPIDLNRVKLQVATKYRTAFPSNSEIIRRLALKERAKLLKLLRRKATRTISGVTIVAVMTKPSPCPQDEPCVYCPGGSTIGVPQSYTGFEPAAMRGLTHKFDPYLQVKSRIDQLQAIGHIVDKIELIIMGGTFPATPEQYQQWFIKGCLDAITNKLAENLEITKKIAETSTLRNVGITVETRPDWAKTPHIDDMLNLGVTRVELGVQNPNNAIYRLVGRTHSVQDVIQSTQMIKDAGLKLVYHLMPGLPGSSQDNDIQIFKEIFQNSNFKPDMVKIYPCLVLKGTKLHQLYLKKTYKPYTTKEAVDLITELKKSVPRWVRIMRIQRDIPSTIILGGPRKSNLRQLIFKKMKEQKLKCQCIRCREIKNIRFEETNRNSADIEISSMKYNASEGEEVFIAAEQRKSDRLIGYLRLRIPSSKAHRPEIKQESCAVIRELHVYGALVPVGFRDDHAWQHQGYGKKLLKRAEMIAEEEYDLKKILVTSALGTKRYYMRFGYKYDGPYMSKCLGR